jgi:hypothetical protein
MKARYPAPFVDLKLTNWITFGLLQSREFDSAIQDMFEDVAVRIE